jgi:hypothetical protein
VNKFSRVKPQAGGAFLAPLLVGEDSRHPYRWYPGTPLDKWVGLIPSPTPYANAPQLRSIRVAVHPEEFSAALIEQQQPFVVLERKTLEPIREWWQARLHHKFRGFHNVSVQFPVHGSLGILTKNSEVIVSRVEVIPLDK